MGLGNRRQKEHVLAVSADRLASLAGGHPVSAELAATSASSSEQGLTTKPISLEPDLSRIRPRGIEETEEQRKKRLTAKTVNFTASFIARLVIMTILAKFGYETYEMTGAVHRGAAAGLFLLTADFGRAVLKAMEPGTK